MLCLPQWCGPCKVIAPIFEALSKENPAIYFLKVDVDEVTVSGARSVAWSSHWAAVLGLAHQDHLHARMAHPQQVSATNNGIAVPCMSLTMWVSLRPSQEVAEACNITAMPTFQARPLGSCILMHANCSTMQSRAVCVCLSL